jgi:ribosomal protein L3
MGGDTVTVKNLEVIEVRDGVLVVKGAVPGARNTVLELRTV